MKINPNQTRGLDRILNNQFGSGTSIISEGSSVKLIPGEKDIIQISQLGNRLQILVNNSEKFLLTERESKNFMIQGNQKDITFDPSVSLFLNPKNTISPSESLTIPKISSERGEQLGHARRVEASFETAVTRRVITDDLREDVFINHIGHQMQRLISETGNTSPQVSLRSQQDLLPFLVQLDQITSNPKAFFPKDLNITLKRIVQDIQLGKPIELEMLAGQVNRGLRQIIDSKTSPAELQAGKIPFEARDIPFGETQLAVLQKGEMINEAFMKIDIPKLREFAGDSSFTKLALPTEKAAFLNILSKHASIPETSAAERMLDRQVIAHVLQSAENNQEFRSILNTAGFSEIQQLFKDAPIEFNITAHAFQSPELVIDSNFLGGEYIKAFNPREIFNMRGLMQARHLRVAEDVVRFSENPLMMAITSPAEKAELIKTLLTGYVSVAENRAIINILQSAMDKTEFTQIVESAGGKAISLALQDPLSLQQWNRLAGAYDRMDLTTDFVEGIKYSEALLHAFPFETGKAVQIAPLFAGSILREHSVGDVAKLLDGFMNESMSWIGKQINVLERGVFVQAGLENLNRMMHELPLFDVSMMRNALFSLLQQPLVQPQQIFVQLQNFISSAGLTEYDVRNLISQPLAFLYRSVATNAENLGQDAMSFLREKFQLAVFQFGPKSAEAAQIQKLFDRTQITFLPFVERLYSISNLLSEMFMAPADFMKSLARFTSELKQNVLPILSAAYPQFTSPGVQLFENVEQIQKLVKGTFEVAPAVSNAVMLPISQLGNNLKVVKEGIELIQSGFLAREFPKLTQVLSQIPEVPKELIQLAKQSASFFTAIHDGSYAKTFQEISSNLTKFDDPIAESTKTIVQDGIFFLNQLQTGTFVKVYDNFLKDLNRMQNDPAVPQLNEFLIKLGSLTNGILAKPGAPNFIGDVETVIAQTEQKELRGIFTNVLKAAAAFRTSPAYKNLIDLTERSGKFLNSLHQGDLAQSMDLMNSRFGYSPAVAQIIERGLHLATTSTNVVKNLVARDYERPLAQIKSKAQAKTQAAKEMPDDVLNLFPTVSNVFSALVEVENMNLLWHYHRQLDLLNDKTDSAVRSFEKQMQNLASQSDLKEILQRQIKAFQSAAF